MNAKALNRSFLEALESYRRYHSKKSFGNISHHEYMTMKIIECGKNKLIGGIYVSEIAKKLEISVPAVSKMLQSLEQKGLVERKLDENSRRNTIVKVTEIGKNELEIVDRELLKDFKLIAEEMGEEELVNLIVLFNKLCDATKTVRERERSNA